MSRTILIVEDEVNLARVIRTELENSAWSVFHASTGENAVALLEERFDVMLLDLNLPGMSGMDVFRSMGRGPDSPEVVIVTGNADVSVAVEAMKLGAYDYLLKPVPMERLFLVLEKALDKARLRFRNLLLEAKSSSQDKHLANLVIMDPVMSETFELAERVAGTESSVLITGETGTGKDVLANFIHRSSLRRNGPFVSVNCASFQESTLENELFGHEKGAFTDAKERKLGFFEIASGGTIFLDEISEMPLGMQAKLLHVLEKGEFYRLGGTRVIRSDARILAATNRNILKSVKNGSFREDLYFRINMFTIDMPPLRRRPDEIIPLAELFLKDVNAIKFLSDTAKERLLSYSWPGNVRELKHVINRANILAIDEFIDVEHLRIEEPWQPSQGRETEEAGWETRTLRQLEIEHMRRVLTTVKWKRIEAAGILGIDPKTLYRKIKMYGLEPDKP